MRISFASGKGGTGKTTLAMNFSLVARDELTVSYLDCDVEEPNAHLFLNPSFEGKETVPLPVPRVDRDRCTLCGACRKICAFGALSFLGDRVFVLEHLCHGCGGCVRVCPAGALTEVPRPLGTVEWGQASGMAFRHGLLKEGEALAVPVIRALMGMAPDSALTVIDAPPGSSCPAVESVRDSDYCLLVTEPTPFGLHDLKLALDMVKKLGLEAGVVINRSGEGAEETLDFCRREGVRVLAELPWDREVASWYSIGVPAVVRSGEWTRRFRELFHRVRRLVEAGGTR